MQEQLGQQTAPSLSWATWCIFPGFGSVLDRDFPKGSDQQETILEVACPCFRQLVFFPLLMVTESFQQGIVRALEDHELWDGCWSQLDTMGCLGAA